MSSTLQETVKGGLSVFTGNAKEIPEEAYVVWTSKTQSGQETFNVTHHDSSALEEKLGGTLDRVIDDLKKSSFVQDDAMADKSPTFLMYIGSQNYKSRLKELSVFLEWSRRYPTWFMAQGGLGS